MTDRSEMTLFAAAMIASAIQLALAHKAANAVDAIAAQRRAQVLSQWTRLEPVPAAAAFTGAAARPLDRVRAEARIVALRRDVYQPNDR